MGDSTTELVNDFVAEAREHLAGVEPDLLALERQGDTPDPAPVQRAFRAIHSIKGGASFLSFEALKRLSHTMEGVLARIRDGHLAADGPTVDVLLRGVDVLRAMVDDVERSDEIPHQVELRALDALIAGDRTATAPPSSDPTEVALTALEAPAEDVATCLAQGMRLCHLETAQHDALATELPARIAEVGRLLGSRELVGTGRVRHLLASVLDSELLAGELGVPVGQLTPIAAEPLRTRLREIGLGSRTQPEPPLSAPTSRPVTAARDASIETPETLRVRLELLDRLMNTAGELVLGRNQLLRTLEGLPDAVPGLHAVLQHLDRVTTELQDDIMQTRMQPVGLLFARFPRAARDQARDLGKQVDVVMSGESVEVDKSIIEALAAPLTHLVRNSIGHGLETPEERRSAGKSPRGQITLQAQHENGQVTVIVSDDGRGMNEARILAQAVEQGLVDERGASALRTQDIIDLTFTPGFSTTTHVSDLAGRGVGLDVVRANVERLGGQVEVETELGIGTSIVMRLPLTLAIIPSLIVGVQGSRFAVPQSSIVELVWVRAEQVVSRVETIQDAPVLRLRGRLLPMVRLREVLGMPADYVEPVSREPSPDRRARIADRRSAARGDDDSAGGRRAAPTSDYNILVLRAGSNRFGLIVDELFESEEIVVKPLPAYVKHLECFAGTTILGDGSVTMILEPGGVASRAGLEFTSIASEEGRRRAEDRVERGPEVAHRAVILFDAAPNERFAVPLEQVLRVERIDLANLRRLGGREYVEHRGSGLPVLRLESVLPVSRVPDDAEEAFLLVPRSAPATTVASGLLVWRIVDALDIPQTFDPPLFDGPGLLGSAVVDGCMTTLVDPCAIAIAAQPREAS